MVVYTVVEQMCMIAAVQGTARQRAAAKTMQSVPDHKWKFKQKYCSLTDWPKLNKEQHSNISN